MAKRNTLLVCACAFALIIFLSNSNNPPNGRTGAPGDGNCVSCHDGNNPNGFNGDITISGIPGEVDGNTTYPISVSVNNPNGLATRGGFQWVALYNQNNQNAGSISNPGVNSSLTTSGNRTYHEHRPSVSFGSGSSVSWTANWTSPPATEEDQSISFYSIAVIGNGSGTSGDLVVTSRQETILKKASIAPLAIEILNTVNVSCFGESDGSSEISVSGGLPPYSISWSSGEEGEIASNLSEGLNTVVVTDNDGNSESVNVLIQSPNELDIALINLQNIDCTNDSGTISIAVSGGNAPYNFNWSNGRTESTVNNLFAGVNTVTITDSNGCEKVAIYEINEEPPVSIQSIEIEDPRCKNEKSGSISVMISEGAEPITFQWSTGELGSELSGLGEGIYSLTITDGNNCELFEDIELKDPELIQPNLSKLDQSLHDENDGSASVNPTGGSGSYSILWSTGSTELSIANLAPGDYSVTVTDDNNCIAEQAFSINSVDCTLEIGIQITDVLCSSEANGSIAINLLEGTAPFSFNWSNGSNSQDQNNLETGEYSLTVTDSKGCSIINTIDISNIDTLGPIIETVSNFVLELNEFGEAALSIDDIILSVEDECAIASLELSQSLFTCSDIGIYELLLLATDENGNFTQNPLIINVEDPILPSINCPEPIQISFCESLSYPEIIGTDNCGSYVIELLNGLGKNGDFQAGSSIETFRITDESGNISECSFEIEIFPEIELELETQIPSSPDSSDGQVLTSISGGLAPYQFEWYSEGNIISTDQNLLNASEGIYTLVVTDIKNCSKSVEVDLNLNVSASSDFEKDKDIKIYPNPSKGWINIQINENNKLEERIEVFSSQGKMVHIIEKNIHSKANNELNLSSLNSGIYYIKFKVGLKQYVKKIILLD